MLPLQSQRTITISIYLNSQYNKLNSVCEGGKMKNRAKLLLLYIIFSTIWILVTDNIVVFSNIPKQIVVVFQNVKGIIFVLLTSVFIYYLVLKKEAYEKEKAENNKLHVLINSMVDFVNFKDGDGRWTEANDFAIKLFQLEHINFKGKKDSELAQYSDFHAESLQYCETSDEQAWQIGKPSRCIEEIPMPSGGFKTFDTIKIPSFYSNGERKELVVMGRDITEQVQAEKKLAESEQKYKSLFEFNPELVFMIDLEGRLTNANDHIYRYTGYRFNELKLKTVLPIISKKDRKKVLKAFHRIFHANQPYINEEIEILTKEGTTKIVRCTSVPMTIDDEIVGVIGYAVDITKEIETEQLLRKTEKLSVVGELAASVAHEIRNPLTSIKGFLQMLKTSSKENEFYYNIMLEELERINIIASELLVLAKPQKIQFTRKDLNQLLLDVQSLIESEANLYGVTLEVVGNDKIPEIQCEPNQLKQLFINLIKNSIEAEANHVKIFIRMLDKTTIQISLQDDGFGIEEERLKHLGEPFYSMKEKGTGLGLTVSYRIVHFHRGEITFKSKVNEGTTVEITLPIENNI